MGKFQIHVAESMNLTAEQRMRLEKLGKVKYFEGVPETDELLKRAEGAAILCCDWAPIDAAIPKMKPGVKLISLPFTGVGFLPLKEAVSKGIKIANSPGCFTESVGEFGMGLMLALVRKIYSYARDEPKPEIAGCLYNRTIGILGAGRIGSYVGKLAAAFGMKVLFWKRGDDLPKVLKNSDIVYCALPLSDETKGLLGEKEFASMKHGSYFVTTSHHLIYNHTALLKALDKKLEGAAMDLEGTNCGDYNTEVYMKFKNHPKVLATPHVAFKTDYGQKRGYDIMVDNIEAFVKGKPINIVN
jgi:phosphoglycerate dehydrogenase-like enzyme